MLHVVRLIERRFPEHGDAIVRALIILSAAALVVGVLIALS